MGNATITQKMRAISVTDDILDMAIEEHRISAQRLKALIPRKPRVIALEGDHGVQQVYQRLLREIADVVPLKRVTDLAPYLKDHCVDLILLDSIGLPGIRAIRRYAPDVAIVVVSGAPTPYPLPEGVSLWIEKPFDTKSLYKLVETELNSYANTLVT